MKHLFQVWYRHRTEDEIAGRVPPAECNDGCEYLEIGNEWLESLKEVYDSDEEIVIDFVINNMIEEINEKIELLKKLDEIDGDYDIYEDYIDGEPCIIVKDIDRDVIVEEYYNFTAKKTE